jgi:hypothetical protein
VPLIQAGLEDRAQSRRRGHVEDSLDQHQIRIAESSYVDPHVSPPRVSLP